LKPLILVPLMLLTACGGAAQQARPAPIAPAPVQSATGLDRVMGKDARSLVQLFGSPVQDVREETGRKLQFAGKECILDTYLYPPTKGKEPVVTYVAARVSDGRDADRASCVTALSKR
jgi:hypothetical protein